MVENGVRKRPHTGISRRNARDAICAFKFAPSRHTFDLHTFLRLTRALSFAGGWRKCGTLLIFCQTVVLVCPLLLQEKQEARVKWFAVAHFRKRPEVDPPVSRYMNAAARGGGASIRPTLSTTWPSRSLGSEARRLDAHIHGQLGSTLSPLTKLHLPRRPCCSLELNRRSGASVPSRESERVRSSSFAKKNNEEISGWYHASKYWLFATFARLFSNPHASSRCLPSSALRRTTRLAPTIVQDPGLPIRRRSRRTWSQERLRRDAS